MEKKMYKYTPSQNDNIKNLKKQKEIKLLTNYIPVKKAHAQSHISDYETEQSIHKNFSSKCQKKKLNKQANSVQITRINKFSPNKNFKQNNSKGNSYCNISKSSKGSFYNLNNLNIYDYFSEKVILTQKKFIDYKINKINTLKKELSLIKREISLYTNNNSKNKNLNNNSMNKNMSINQIVPKIVNPNKNNNNSYISSNIFCKEVINNAEIIDKKLENHLSNLLAGNNSENNLKFKNNAEKENINDNKKKLLNIIYQSKKGRYNHNSNNYEHNTKNFIQSNNINLKKEKSFKNKNMDQEIIHTFYFFENKIKEKQNQNMDNKTIKKFKNFNNLNLEREYQALKGRMDKLFNNFFEYYDKKNQNEFCQQK